MKSFSELTLQKLTQDGTYYVYGLIDPRDNTLFYIGKGSENRVFQHELESSMHPESEKKKLQIIKSIEDSGLSVKHIIIHAGLTESESFAAESALINLIKYLPESKLVNEVAGHHSMGCMSTEEIERIYGAIPLLPSDIKHKLVVIKVNKLYERNMSEQEVYDIVRGIWRANINRASKADYVLGVYNNLIIGCYKPDRWLKVKDCDIERLPGHAQDADLDYMAERILFECDQIEELDDNQKYYLFKSIENIEYVQKSQNPISYIGYE